MVYTPLAPASRKKECGLLGRVEQSHEQCSALTDSGIVLLVCHGRISPAALLEGLHGPPFPSARIFRLHASGVRVTLTLKEGVLVLVTHHLCWSIATENVAWLSLKRSKVALKTV